MLRNFGILKIFAEIQNFFFFFFVQSTLISNMKHIFLREALNPYIILILK